MQSQPGDVDVGFAYVIVAQLLPASAIPFGVSSGWWSVKSDGTLNRKVGVKAEINPLLKYDFTYSHSGMMEDHTTVVKSDGYC